MNAASESGSSEPVPYLKLIEAIDPAAYAKTRNHLEGAVTGLSPWITHGVITLRDLASALASRHSLSVQHSLIYEFGWRAYFRHVFEYHPEAFYQSLRQGPLPDHAYQPEMPLSLTEARSGIPAIDAAVTCLYQTGNLHNHARMWLASYCVHLCRVRWQTGAHWMIQHLLDGDIASNSLSWQWVAGTFSKKPYLFNAENVARFAPASWWSPGTSIDTDYARLEAISRGAKLIKDPPAENTLLEPARFAPSQLPESVKSQFGMKSPADYLNQLQTTWASTTKPPAIWLVHPWALRKPPTLAHTDAWHAIGFIPQDAAFMVWTLNRWQWVLDAMRKVCDDIVIGSTDDVKALVKLTPRLHTWRNIHLNDYWPLCVEQCDETALFPEVDRFHASFSSWWKAVSRRYDRLDDLLLATGRHASG